MAKSVGFEIKIKYGSGKIPRNHIYIAIYIASPMLRGQGRHTRCPHTRCAHVGFRTMSPRCGSCPHTRCAHVGFLTTITPPAFRKYQ